MNCEILLKNKALHQLILLLETIENEEDVDRGMVSLFCHLHHVTPNFLNLNNSDQMFLYFTNKDTFYDNDDDEHLPIPLYSGIKTSMGTEFILNKLLSLSRFSTERKLLLNDTLIGYFRNAKLIREEDDPESLHNYSNQVMNIFVNNQLLFFPNVQHMIDNFII